MRFIAWASAIYGGVLLLGILVWAWRNSKKRLFIPRGFPPELVAKFPPLSKAGRRQALRWGIPVFIWMGVFPLAYSIYCRVLIGDELPTVLAANAILLFTFNLVDLLVIDWLIICLITPKIFVVPGTEGDPGYKDYAFHLKGAIRGLAVVAIGSLVVTGIAEVGYLLVARR